MGSGGHDPQLTSLGGQVGKGLGSYLIRLRVREDVVYGDGAGIHRRYKLRRENEVWY